jgi:hypothetical protein
MGWVVMQEKHYNCTSRVMGESRYTRVGIFAVAHLETVSADEVIVLAGEPFIPSHLIHADDAP